MNEMLTGPERAVLAAFQQADRQGRNQFLYLLADWPSLTTTQRADVIGWCHRCATPDAAPVLDLDALSEDPTSRFMRALPREEAIHEGVRAAYALFCVAVARLGRERGSWHA